MSYTNKDIFEHVDHTKLSPNLTKKDICNLISEAMNNNIPTICIPSSMVKFAKDYMDENYKPLKKNICTVVGFPNGNCSTAAKLAETNQAIMDGAKEIDMVINISALKDGQYKYVTDEIRAIAEACHFKRVILKVIIETCYLIEEEIRLMCVLCAVAGADYIKTSTGFGPEGATKEVVSIMADEIKMKNLNLQIKAAGGIRSREDMVWYLENGCSRLGTSSAVKILNS